MKKASKEKKARTAPLLLCFALPLLSFAQTNVLTVVPPAKITAKAGSTVEAKISLELKPGYHCNSDKPSEDYLIPLKLTWNAGLLESTEVVYPKPQMEKYSFSPTPLSVYTGNFELVTKFKVAANAAPGSAVITGKVGYQACTDRMCLRPAKVEVTLPVDIVK